MHNKIHHKSCFNTLLLYLVEGDGEYVSDVDLEEKEGILGGAVLSEIEEALGVDGEKLAGQDVLYAELLATLGHLAHGDVALLDLPETVETGLA